MWLTTSGVYLLIFLLLRTSVLSGNVSVVLKIIEMALYFSFIYILLLRLDFLANRAETPRKAQPPAEAVEIEATSNTPRPEIVVSVKSFEQAKSATRERN